MKKEMVTRLHADFERLVKTVPDSDVEFWYARDLQEQLGYTKWENFTKSAKPLPKGKSKE